MFNQSPRSRHQRLKAVLDSLKFCSLSLHDQEGQKKDILNYIRFVVHSDPKTRRWRAEEKEQVIDVLLQKANGMCVTYTTMNNRSLMLICRFRWVFCQFDFLRHCLPGRVRSALAELPETLDATYERTLREINKAKWEFAHRLLQCVAVASRPLDVEELAEFLAFEFKGGPIPEFHEDMHLEDPVDAVMSTCSSLLTIVNLGFSRAVKNAPDPTEVSSSTRHRPLAPDKPISGHFSVKEYLISSRLAEANDIISRRYHVSLKRAHTLIAQACLGILLHMNKSITRHGLRKYPLAEYAAEHWIDHALFEGVSENAEDGMKELFDPRKPHLGIWLWIHDPRCPPQGEPNDP
jgi:hypothetical protein